MKEMFLSVVIPCYDEMANLQKGVLEKVNSFLQKQKFSFEVIIVDDGSKDGSIEFLKEFSNGHPKFQLIGNPHLGKAGAVTAGMLKAKGQYILFTDTDQATPIEEIQKLLDYFDPASGGYDIVIGSRSGARKGAPWTRLLMARSMMILRRMIVGISGISDTQCGFKMFRRDAAQKLFQKISDLHRGFHTVAGSNVSAGFDVELLFLAQKMGMRIHEVPVHWLYVETRRVSPIKDSLEGLLELFRIKQNDMSGKYDI